MNDLKTIRVTIIKKLGDRLIEHFAEQPRLYESIFGAKDATLGLYESLLQPTPGPTEQLAAVRRFDARLVTVGRAPLLSSEEWAQLDEADAENLGMLLSIHVHATYRPTITVREWAARRGIPVRTALGWATRGVLPAFQSPPVRGGAWLVAASAPVPDALPEGAAAHRR
ncbi:hypothetical protein HNQ07_004515 [Deinococcus metalli]|uniref:Uncharacterized protein n=1 Tax=Deinococcus metalli TaxID=1141878 RepID=A0A7W8KJE5_9DEIO|nr:hypothetical protein [Deinococcus metalli]MBB5379005.1 hypothetical protein [Deinococcus metalli]GHF63420.1 hypothetical protein GCM10017781_44200 [Deinococcus metalli]